MPRSRSTTDTLRAHILSAIAESPGINIDGLTAAHPAMTRRQIHNALHELRVQGRIESPAYRCYRLPSAHRQRSPAGAGQTAPMHRLMAGR